jgi:hypothetical protein
MYLSTRLEHTNSHVKKIAISIRLKKTLVIHFANQRFTRSLQRGRGKAAPAFYALFVWLISHQPAVLFSQNKLAISNQPAVLFSQSKSAPTISR